MNKVYATDVTDEQWALIEPLIPLAKHGGSPRTVNLRLVFNTILYLNKTGCQWAMLPKDLAKRSTAFDYFSAWKKDGTWQNILDTLRCQVRTEAGREPAPQKAAIDSQTVKGSEAGGPRGYDGGKKIGMVQNAPVSGNRAHPQRPGWLDRLALGRRVSSGRSGCGPAVPTNGRAAPP